MRRVLPLLGLLCFWCADLQSQSVAEILDSIELNNLELSLLHFENQKNYYELKSENIPENLNATLFYLPFGDAVSGDYWEYQFDQTFSFPTVYSRRNKIIELQKEKMDYEYSAMKQEILSQALEQLYDYITLDQRLSLEKEHLQRAKTLFGYIQNQYEQKQISPLDYSTAKISLLNMQINQKNLAVEKERLEKNLEKLNGGKALKLENLEFDVQVTLPNKDSLLREMYAGDPFFKIINQDRYIASQNQKLSRAQNLPDITIGYNYQGYKNDNYRGPLIGLGVPLWGRKNKRKMNQYNLDWVKRTEYFAGQSQGSEYEQLYEEYEKAHKLYQAYRSAMQEMPVDLVLSKDTAEVRSNVPEYIEQMEFYYEAQNTLLDLQNQVYQLRRGLTKHRL